MAEKKTPLRVFHWHGITYRRVRVVNLHQVLFRYADPIVPETNPHVSTLISSLNPFCDLPPAPDRPPFDFSKYAVFGERDTVCGVRAFKLSFQNTTHTGFEKTRTRRKPSSRVCRSHRSPTVRPNTPWSDAFKRPFRYTHTESAKFSAKNSVPCALFGVGKISHTDFPRLSYSPVSEPTAYLWTGWART